MKESKTEICMLRRRIAELEKQSKEIEELKTMLSDEEKEAIEWLKRLVKINKRDNLDNTYAEILLNLIEKQSKESGE